MRSSTTHIFVRHSQSCTKIRGGKCPSSRMFYQFMNKKSCSEPISLNFWIRPRSMYIPPTFWVPVSMENIFYGFLCVIYKARACFCVIIFKQCMCLRSCDLDTSSKMRVKVKFRQRIDPIPRRNCVGLSLDEKQETHFAKTFRASAKTD